MVIKILPNDKSVPTGKLADAEGHFTEGALDGLRLLGFAVWERRNGPDNSGGAQTTSPEGTFTICSGGFSPQMDAVCPSGLNLTRLTLPESASNGPAGSPAGTENNRTPPSTMAMRQRPSGA